jgi:hypothetical protein
VAARDIAQLPIVTVLERAKSSVPEADLAALDALPGQIDEALASLESQAAAGASAP